MKPFVILRSPTRQSRFGDGAAAGPKDLLTPLVWKGRSFVRSELALS